MSIQFVQSVAELRATVERQARRIADLEAARIADAARIESLEQAIESLRATVATAAIISRAPRKESAHG